MLATKGSGTSCDNVSRSTKDSYNKRRRELYSQRTQIRKDEINDRRRQARLERKKELEGDKMVTNGTVRRKRPIPTEPFVLPLASPCVYCYAKRFPFESEGFCCSKGQVRLSPVGISNDLLDLYRGCGPSAMDFRRRVLPYNNMFAFTSFGVSLDPICTKNNHGIYTFRAQGQIYHYIQGLYPTNGRPSYLQLYFYDTEREVEHRFACLEGLDPEMINQLMVILEPNPYSRFFRSLAKVTDIDSYQIVLRADPCVSDKTFSAPTTSQVAVIWKDTEDASALRERDILVHKHDGQIVRIKYYFGCYDPLQYPLLFPFGEPGWHRGIMRVTARRAGTFAYNELLPVPSTHMVVEDFMNAESLASEENREKANTVSAREFYAYRFQMRPVAESTVLESGRLLQQYAVDMYVKIESSRLDFFRHNQAEIRAELYHGIVDSVARGETRGSQIGKRIVLPSSFIGGPRDMRKRYLDAMALVDKYGKPDIFLTMTCNPNWVEITNELKPHEQAQNRPDIVARVFKSKFEQLKKEVVKKKLFGPVQAYTYVIEFQKRGLPHVHMLIILKCGYKLTNPDNFDQFISAEIPNEQDNPHLYSAVLKHMMHGPCGELNKDNVCMKNGKCKSYYPKEFNNVTNVAADGYPIYMRRDENRQARVRRHILDNRWVVPYNPYLLAMFDCHVNVEICSTIKAVKYLYKYIYKGHDKIAFKIVAQEDHENYDEITQYQSARWVTPQEAMWRIYKFNLFDMHPSVIVLQLHLENCHIVPLNRNTNLDAIIDTGYYSKTMLTQFFVMNSRNDKAKFGNFLYKDFPTSFVWQSKSRSWVERRHKNVIGRMITINPSQGELYYLRLLLNYVCCPTSFVYLRTVGGMTYSTYREAALAHGLLNDDKGNEKCLEEACGYQMPKSLRQLFCTLLIYCEVVDPKALLIKFEDFLIEDFVKMQKLPKNIARQYLMRHVKSAIESMGKTLEQFGLVDLIENVDDTNDLCREILDEQNTIVSEIDLQNVGKLNIDQSTAYNAIVEAVRLNNGTSYFIDGPGGTGKTFLYRALLATVRTGRTIAIATATSGVAASILPNGRTAHSRFKIPIDGQGSLCCNVGKQTGLAKLLKAAGLIIWDEASMAKRQSIEALDMLLRDITEVDQLFGGKVVVLGGDFRQVLPVIPSGTREDCIDASLVRSYIWQSLQKFTLKENMRARTDPLFSSFLLRVGNGEESCNTKGEIMIPDSIFIRPSTSITPRNQLIQFVFPDLGRYMDDAMSMMNSAILSAKNESVDEINNELINRFPGKRCVFLSNDETLNPNDQGLYIDFLHTVSPVGLPAHQLVLKENCPIMMLRNLDPSKGMCNGTRLICRKFEKNVIIAEIAVGEHRGNIVFIPRIPLQPSDPKLYPVQFTRRQFPIRLCFAMTINKAQGQTLDIVGVDLQQPVFSHGQLYVALSRATMSSKIKVILDACRVDKDLAGLTRNIVYSEILCEARQAEVSIDS